MDIKLDNIDNVSAKLTVKVKSDDYKENLEKALKDYRRKAQFKGFRPGCVPLSIITKLYGAPAKAEEISKAVSNGIEDYLKKNKIDILGHILEDKDQKPQDYDKADDFDFLFDIALAPKFDMELTAEDAVPYYDIEISDKFVDERVKEFALSRGKFEKVDSYEKGDYLKGNMTENSPAKDTEGLNVDDVLISPEYLKDAKQKKLFDGAKKGDIITLTPSKMYAGKAQAASMLKIKEEEVDSHKGDFSYTITEINRRVPAEVNQELFDEILGKDKVKDEKEFRQKIRENFEGSNVSNSNYKFLLDLQDYCIKKAGKIDYSEPLLKRLMKENNQDKDDKFIDENYPSAVRQLLWQEIKGKLAVKANIKVEDNDLKDAARRDTAAQFAQYGMQVPAEVIEKYADETLKKHEQIDRLVDEVIDAKLIGAYKDIVKLEHKKIGLDEFNKMLK